MTYSHDLRIKSLDYIEKGGSKAEASRIFGVTTIEPPTSNTTFNQTESASMSMMTTVNPMLTPTPTVISEEPEYPTNTTMDPTMFGSGFIEKPSFRHTTPNREKRSYYSY